VSVVLLLTVNVMPVAADATLSAAINGISAPRPTIGVAWGRWGDQLVGFELEYAGSPGESTNRRPGLHSLTANLLLRGPFITGRTHVYLLGGVAYYIDRNQDFDAWNLGLGSKTWIASHLAFRIDFRRYFSPDFDRARSVSPRRLSAGMSLAF
jgi:hypothetical protein